jgi:protein involved in polysaccharide export with SLBB domain
MAPGEGGTFWRTAWAGLVLCCLAGCGLERSQVDRALSTDRGLQGSVGAEEPYAVHCPDVLQVTFADRPEWSGPRTVGADGCIDLEPLGHVRVEGQTAGEIIRRVAQQTGIPAERIHVDVTAFNSQQIYIFGQVVGLQRAVPYRGQETVLEVLQRVGGITAGAAPNDVYVVRSHIAEASQPEVFHINLRAITLADDQKTNLRLQPFDQVYVGETRQAGYAKCLPPCLRPFYELACGLRRPQS